MSLLSRPIGFAAHGVDGCRAGWLVVTLHPNGRSGWSVKRSFADVVVVAGKSDRVFVDILIGLPWDARERKCDLAARAKLTGSRA